MKTLPANMRRAAAKGFINATDCADYLTKKDVYKRQVQKELAEVLALGEPTTTALTEKPNLSPAVKPTTACLLYTSRCV